MAEDQNVYVRRAEYDDADAILELIGPEAQILEQRFGQYNISNIIETSSLSVTMIDAENNVVGFAAFNTYPIDQKAQVDQGSWESWLHRLYGQWSTGPYNTLWLTFFCANHLYEHEVAENMMRTYFVTLPRMETCLFMMPATSIPFSPIFDIFEPIKPLGTNREPNTVCRVKRLDFAQTLNVRVARVEDHDDLVPVFNNQSEVLQERYGEFFLAELIEGQNESDKALVAEHPEDSRSIGLLSLTSDLDIKLLRKCFELKPYDGLVRMNDRTTSHLENRKQRKIQRRKDARKHARMLEREAALAEQLEEEEKLRQARLEAGELESEDGNEEGEEGTEGHDRERRDTVTTEKERRDTSATDPPPASTEPKEATLDGDEVGSGEDDEEGNEAAEADEEAVEEEDDDEDYGAITVDIDDSDSDDEFEYESNAFCVTLFCLDEPFESRAMDFLQGAFELYPERDYMVITLPHSTAEIPLLDHFTLIPQKENSTFSHALYVFHKAALIPSMQVRQARPMDLENILPLLNGIDQSETIESLVTDTIGGEGSSLVTYVAVVEKSIVGVCVLESDVDVEELKCHFGIEDFINFTEHRRNHHMYLKYYVINPIFERKGRFFLQEIFRVYRKTCMYYRLLAGDPYPSITKSFVQVKPRHKPQMPGDNEEGPIAHTSLYFMTRKLIFEPKVAINSRIVIVGASDCGLSFLESLQMVPYLRFNNLYLVSPGGFPEGTDPAHPPHRATNLNYSKRAFHQLALGSRVRAIDAKMVNIDRVDKHIIVDKGQLVPYDHLIITTGLQDGTPHHFAPDALPIGYISLVGEQSELEIDAYLADFFLESSGQVVVYGHVLGTYSLVQGLLRKGVESSRIIMMSPPAKGGGAQPSLFLETIEEQLTSALNQRSIAHVKDVTLVDFEEFKGRICAALFNVPGDPERRREPCHLLVSCDRGNVDRDVFHAVNDNSLVYDGRLVVDCNFRTTDPAIFSAGPVAKFARRYRHPKNLEYYNSKEVGRKLAQSILPLLDPLSEVPDWASDDYRLPQFVEPVSQVAYLPGNFTYVDVVSRAVPEEVSKGADGRDLITSESDDQLTRIRVSPYGCIDRITYVGLNPVETHNLLALCDLPQTYVNNLVSRYDEGLIQDLISFFRQPWASALYHDHFPLFRRELSSMFNEMEELRVVIDEVRDFAPRQASLHPLQMKQYRDQLKPQTKHLVQVRVADFLRINANHLPMYLAPYVEYTEQGDEDGDDQ